MPVITRLDVAVEQNLKLPQFVPLICHLGKKKLRMVRASTLLCLLLTLARPFDIESIKICDQLTDEETARVKVVIRAHAHVLEGHDNSLLLTQAFQH
jgi:hypothetical protein